MSGPNPCHSPDVRKTAIDVMKQGGKDIADRAYWKWHNGEYGEDPDGSNQRRWREVKTMIDYLVAQLTCIYETPPQD